MKKTTEVYHLYCINMQCPYSVFQLMVETRLPETTENLLTRHTCNCCGRPLVSTLDMKSRSLVTETKSRMLYYPAYANN